MTPAEQALFDKATRPSPDVPMMEPTYLLEVNARQLHYMRLAIQMFIQNDPGEELDSTGQDIPTVLEEFLGDPNLFPSPDINSFVV